MYNVLTILFKHLTHFMRMGKGTKDSFTNFITAGIQTLTARVTIIHVIAWVTPLTLIKYDSLK